MTRPLRAALSALVLALVTIRGAEAQTEATLTLSQEAAYWNEVVVARIVTVACHVELSGGPVVGFTPGVGWTVDIGLAVFYCPISALPPLTVLVDIGPLPPRDYTVRVFDSGQPVVLATAPLNVYEKASVSVDMPEAATAEVPIPLVLRGPASSGCFLLEPPQLQGRVITATFDDNCPVLPPPGPHLFAEQFPIGPLTEGEYEVRFFEYTFEPRPRLYRQTLKVVGLTDCAPSDTVLCLQNGRFRVEVHWKDFAGNTGPGHTIPLPGRDDSGLFWYFSKGNIELTAKILNACDVVGDGGSWWVFLSSSSTVEYSVNVIDTVTHRTKTYTNNRGQAAPLIADTATFLCAAP